VTTRNSITARNYNGSEVFLQEKRNTLQSRLFEFPFSRKPMRSVVSVFSMFGTEFTWSAYLCVLTCLSGITV